MIGTQPDPPWWLVITSGVLALAGVGYRPAWRITRGVVTIAHEGGHALLALATGRQLQGIRLHSDTSGVTVSRGRPTGPGMVATSAAGYLAPPLLGLGCALLLATDHITAMLWIILALLAGVLILIRNAYGILSVVITGAVVFVVSWAASVTVQAAFAYLSAWFLLFAGVRPVLELQVKRGRRQAPDSDADQLARLTGVPGLVWVGVFGVVALTALVLGARWLVPVETLPRL